MRLRWSTYTLNLRIPFRIAPDVSTSRENFIVDLDGGVGEAAGVPYYDETPDRLHQYFRAVDFSDVHDASDLDGLLARLPEGSMAGRAACDIALHDLWGKELGQPLYRLFGLKPSRMKPTSFTIAMDDPVAVAAQAIEADLPILKVKLGDDDDEQRVLAIRGVSNAVLRVDANGSWTVEKARRLLPRLEHLGVELVEQPLPAGDLEGLRMLRSVAPRPLVFVDEGVRTMADVLAHAGLVDGIVVKLAKSGGIREAMRQIHVAHALGMQVMMSCMVETSAAVTAAAHIAALADLVDLDTPRLITNDPFVGIRYEGARIFLPERPGLGLTVA